MTKFKDEIEGVLPRIKLMLAANKKNRPSPAFRRLYSIIGLLTVFSAVLIYAGGRGSDYIGRISKTRYEKSSGIFIRSVSAEDSRNYENTKKIILLGHVLKTASYFVFFLGITILIKPELLYYELKRWGLLKETRPGRNTNKQKTVD